MKQSAVRSWLIFLLGCALGGGIVLGAAVVGWPGPTPRTPSLLENVSAGGGWWGACPSQNAEEASLRERSPIATSPELNERLRRLFPSGTNEKVLIDALSSQGFSLLPPCAGDKSIRLAGFQQQGGGLLRYPVKAEVYWKVDESGVIVWTKGFVRYIGF